MPTRRQILSILVSLSLAILCNTGEIAWAQTSGAQSADNTLTVDVLQGTLYAKSDEENEYCEFVIGMRDQGVLPNRILYYAYQKAMVQEKNRRFTYFQKILELACDHQGIVLEDTDEVKVKKFFGFEKTSSKPAKASKAETSTPTLAKPATQNTLSKPFSFFQRLFAR